MKIRMVVANRIHTRRKTLKLRQADLADRLGCSLGQIGHYEKGTRGIMVDTLPALAVALECSLSYLLGEQDRPAKGREYAASLQQQDEQQHDEQQQGDE